MQCRSGGRPERVCAGSALRYRHRGGIGHLLHIKQRRARGGISVVLERVQLIFDARHSFSGFRNCQCLIQPSVPRIAGFKLDLGHEQRVAVNK